MGYAWLAVLQHSNFWTDARVKASLSGIEENKDKLILDLFFESSLSSNEQTHTSEDPGSSVSYMMMEGIWVCMAR